MVPAGFSAGAEKRRINPTYSPDNTVRARPALVARRAEVGE